MGEQLRLHNAYEQYVDIIKPTFTLARSITTKNKNLSK